MGTVQKPAAVCSGFLTCVPSVSVSRILSLLRVHQSAAMCNHLSGTYVTVRLVRHPLAQSARVRPCTQVGILPFHPCLATRLFPKGIRSISAVASLFASLSSPHVCRLGDGRYPLPCCPARMRGACSDFPPPCCHRGNCPTRTRVLYNAIRFCK